jgi:Flp pilus assembly protein TadG
MTGRRLIRVPVRLARRLHRDERGGVFVLVAVLAVGFAAMASFVVDYGRVMNAQKELQAATDAAALAAAQDLPDGAAAGNSVMAYGATQGVATKGNTRPDLTSVSTTYNLKCLTYLKNLGLDLCPNAVQVTQAQQVKLLFLGGLGIPGITVHATSTAAAKGGSPYPLDVVIALDRTGSMSGNKIQQARAGVQEFLSAMRPSSDRIGLVLFPPSNQSSCNYSEPGNPYESAQNGYVAVHLRSDFRTSDSGPLNYGSSLVQAVSGSCPSVGGITAYTTAIQEAKKELDRNGRPNAQDVIIFFTDGEANYGPWYLGTSDPQLRTPCQSAENLASSLKGGAPPPGEPPAYVGGTWIYTILYTTNSSTRCKGWRPKPAKENGTACNSGQNQTFPCDEQPAPITAYDTLRSMASVGTDGQPRFYTSQNDLTQIFKRVALDLSATRLLPDDTQ